MGLLVKPVAALALCAASFFVKHSRRVRLRRLLLLPRAVAPLLLLVPLGALKWRADWAQDHPPLSLTEQKFRKTFHLSPVVFITGEGAVWQQLTGLNQQGVALTDASALQEIIEALRYTDYHPSNVKFHPEGTITLTVPRSGTLRGRDMYTAFTYAPRTTGAYLRVLERVQNTGMVTYVEVQPRFESRFEALIGSLAKQAQAPGPHPGVTLRHFP